VCACVCRLSNEVFYRRPDCTPEMLRYRHHCKDLGLFFGPELPRYRVACNMFEQLAVEFNNAYIKVGHPLLLSTATFAVVCFRRLVVVLSLPPL
jgi:hypothetical protein